MITYASQEHLEAARARYAQLSSRIAQLLAAEYGDSRPAPHVNPRTVSDHALLSSYGYSGGPFPTDDAIRKAIRAVNSGDTPANAFASYTQQVADTERRIGRLLTPAEKLSLARELGVQQEPEEPRDASRAAISNEEAVEAAKRYEAATGNDWRSLSPGQMLDLARHYRAEAAASVPATPVTDEINATGREPTLEERVTMERERLAS